MFLRTAINFPLLASFSMLFFFFFEVSEIKMDCTSDGEETCTHTHIHITLEYMC